MPLFCLDNYSYKYDKKNYLENIEMESKFKREYHIYIIYSVMEQKDQKEFVKNCTAENEFNPEFGHTPFPYCYLPFLRKLSEIENYMRNDGHEIPSNYREIFGVNIYFLFKFLKDGIKFEDFVKKEEKEIKEDLAYFYSDTGNKKNIIENLIQIIENKNTYL